MKASTFLQTEVARIFPESQPSSGRYGKRKYIKHSVMELAEEEEVEEDLEAEEVGAKAGKAGTSQIRRMGLTSATQLIGMTRRI